MRYFSIFITALFVVAIALVPLSLLAVDGTVIIKALVPEEMVQTEIDATMGGSSQIASASGTIATFTFPANFTDEDVEVKAAVFPNDFFAVSTPPPAGEELIAKVYSLNATTLAGVDVTTFDQPITIVLPYTDIDVEGFVEGTLRPYRRESNDTEWTLITGGSLDMDSKTVTFTTTNFSFFTLMATPISSGSGSHGPGITISGTTLAISGWAYPLQKITVLNNGQVAASTTARADASFYISVTGLSAGDHTFSVYAEDVQGRRSTLYAFPVTIINGAITSIRGVAIAPTISLDKREVRRGDMLVVDGQSVPAAQMSISLDAVDAPTDVLKANAQGVYRHYIDTSALEIGDHTIKVKVSLDTGESAFSKVIAFRVGTKNVLAAPFGGLSDKGDLNNDNRINIIDFSIAAYWYKRSSPPASADLNGDGKIDLVDLSIMAFNWTG